MQYVPAAQTYDSISMNEVVLANGTHAVVAVELRHLLGLSWWLRLLHWSLRSLWHPLVGPTLGSSSGYGLPLMLDVPLQVEEHVHVALLSVVEP